MSKQVVLWTVIFCTMACQTDHKSQSSRNPAQNANSAELFNQYCIGEINSANVPQPNYSHPLVAQAKEKFRLIAEQSIYLYPAVTRAYGLRKPEPTDWQKRADQFLTYLCGEFRDRPTLIEAKLIWMSHFNKLSPTEQGPIDPTRNVWTQMTAKAYRPYLNMSARLFSARARRLENQKQNFGTLTNIDSAIPAIRVCETKYIFNQFIVPGKTFEGTDSSLSEYESGYLAFAETPGNCTQDDKADYYDFRGDSNFKPNSPESNGMIWYTIYVAQNCKNTTTVADGLTMDHPNSVDSLTCENYFRHPFNTRWSAAAAGLGTWMLYPLKYSEQFANDHSQQFVVYPHKLFSPEMVKPFGFSLKQGEPPEYNYIFEGQKLNDVFATSDLGYNEYAALGSGQSKPEHLEFVYKRLRDALNRHTDWYASAWDDGLGTPKSLKTQAYSPFVASSYELSKSDQFTYCGITVPCPPDGFKHWMFVFRVKGSHWYTTDRLADMKNNAISFQHMWFDETSFGTTGLAKSERAWDRLGTALEDELKDGAILYLHNITSSDQVSDDGIK